MSKQRHVPTDLKTATKENSVDLNHIASPHPPKLVHLMIINICIYCSAEV